VCDDISMFTSYPAAWDSSVIMGNGSHAYVRGAGTVVHFGEDHAAEEHAACPYYEQEAC
jgi:hypothetical protein